MIQKRGRGLGICRKLSTEQEKQLRTIIRDKTPNQGKLLLAPVDPAERSAGDPARVWHQDAVSNHGQVLEQRLQRRGIRR